MKGWYMIWKIVLVWITYMYSTDDRSLIEVMAQIIELILIHQRQSVISKVLTRNPPFSPFSPSNVPATS